MMDKVLTGVAIAFALGVLAFFFAPLRTKLERKRMIVAGDHGIRVVVSSTPDQLSGVASADMLGMKPGWLLPSTFFVPWDRPPGEAPEGGGEAWWRWAQQYGGQDLGWTHALLQVQATLDRTVILEMPRIVRERSEVTNGSMCGPEGLGGNGLMARQFRVGLDAEPPTVEYLGDHDEGAIPHFRMKKFDSEAFLIIAHAESGRHAWHIELPCVVDGERFTLVAKPQGGNFVTVGRLGLKGFFWVSDEQRWMTTDPEQWRAAGRPSPKLAHPSGKSHRSIVKTTPRT